MRKRPSAMSKNFPLSRRQLIKYGALPLLSSCESLDRWFDGTLDRIENSVVVLGAGAAGLAAAYELKRKKVPVVVFEHGGLPGGRARSLENFNNVGAADLGAEWISADHITTLKLAKEMKIEVVERPSSSLPIYFMRTQPGKNGFAAFSENDLKKEFKLLGKLLLNSDHMKTLDKSAYDWIRKLSKDSFWENLVISWCGFRFGAEPDIVRANFIESAWLGQGVEQVGKFPEARFRFRNGAGAFTYACYERVGSIIPEHTFFWHHTLIDLDESGDNIILIFDTKKGMVRYKTKNVICALPAAVLEKIPKIAQKVPKIKEFRIGTQTKANAGYAKKFWPQNKSSGEFFCFPQNTGNRNISWDASRIKPAGGQSSISQSGSHTNASTAQSATQSSIQSSIQALNPGIFTTIFSGEKGLKAGNHSLSELKDVVVNQFEKEVPKPNVVHIQNWSQLEHFKGSHFVPSPGADFSEFFDSSSKGWYWAGEHTSSLYPGTLEGALESGIKAAKKVILDRKGNA